MCYVQLCSGLLSSFFSLTESEILEQGSREIAREEPNNGLQTKRRNWCYFIVKSEMDSSSFECFHTQLDCKLTYGYKNQTQLTLV